MMYILTQEEFDALQEKKRKITEDAQKILQDLCTRLANSEILPEGHWLQGETWGCVLSNTAECCDDCPVEAVCPNEWKEWSK